MKLREESEGRRRGGATPRNPDTCTDVRNKLIGLISAFLP